jgi:hemerythrin
MRDWAGPAAGAMLSCSGVEEDEQGMSVELRSAPTSGGADIDRKHQEMLRHLGDLVVALERGRREEIPRMFELLGDHVVSRFAAEERAMADSAFPGANVHRAAHARFVRDLAELRALYETNGPSFAIAVKTAIWVRSWLDGHVDGADRAFARFVRESRG